MNERRNDLEIMIEACKLLCRSQTRIDLLFTMSEIPHAHPEGCNMRSDVFADDISSHMTSPSSLFRATPGTLRSPCPAAPREAQRAKRGGARRDRTDDLMLAKHALSQLSYGPVPEDECFTSIVETRCARSKWWAWEDLNFRPHAYQARALTN